MRSPTAVGRRHHSLPAAGHTHWWTWLDHSWSVEPWPSVSALGRGGTAMGARWWRCGGTGGNVEGLQLQRGAEGVHARSRGTGPQMGDGRHGHNGGAPGLGWLRHGGGAGRAALWACAREEPGDDAASAIRGGVVLRPSQPQARAVAAWPGAPRWRGAEKGGAALRAHGRGSGLERAMGAHVRSRRGWSA